MQAVVDEIVLANVNPLKVLIVFILYSSSIHLHSSDPTIYVFNSIRTAGT